MTVAHVYRITFKHRNCTVTVKQDTITHTEKGTNNEVSNKLLPVLVVSV